MPTTMSSVYDSLSVVTITGYEPAKNLATDPVTGETFDVDQSIDRPGDANFLCEAYGMASGDFDDADEIGILHTDYDSSIEAPWTFSVLIETRQVDYLRDLAEDFGYSVDRVEEVSEPAIYGDDETVAICKHPEGWVILG